MNRQKMTDEEKEIDEFNKENQALIAKWIKQKEEFENSWRYKAWTIAFYIVMFLTSPLWLFPLLLLIAYDYHFNK